MGRQIDFTKFPIRTCQSLHSCDTCGEQITLVQKYYDGGYGRRAHVACAIKDLPGKIDLVSVNHGWSLAGYWYVNIRTGANGDRGSHIACVSEEQASAIAVALGNLK